MEVKKVRKIQSIPHRFKTVPKFNTEISESEATLTPLTYIHERLLCWFGTGN